MVRIRRQDVATLSGKAIAGVVQVQIVPVSLLFALLHADHSNAHDQAYRGANHSNAHNQVQHIQHSYRQQYGGRHRRKQWC